MNRLLPLLLILAAVLALAAASSNSTNSHSAVRSSKHSNHKSKNATTTNNDASSSNATTTSSATTSTKTKGSTTKGSKNSGDVGDSSDKDFTLDNLPKTWQAGQSGTNQCNQWGKSSQNSMCQNAFINALDDFCLWAPPTPGPIGSTERIEVSWCMKPGYGTRLIPDGTIQAAHFLQTKDYVQMTGTGDLTRINVPAGDSGGELDPHGADGNGNPIGGLVFTNAFNNKYRQVHEWMTFVSDTSFCFRACKGRGTKAQNLCQHVYDTMGCDWVMPANYGPGFESCEGEVAPPPGIVGTSTFKQGDPVTPSAFPAPSSSKCTTSSTLSAAVTISTYSGATASAGSGSGGAGANAVAAASSSNVYGGSQSSSYSVSGAANSTRPFQLLTLALLSALLSAAAVLF